MNPEEALDILPWGGPYTERKDLRFPECETDGLRSLVFRPTDQGSQGRHMPFGLKTSHSVVRRVSRAMGDS